MEVVNTRRAIFLPIIACCLIGAAIFAGALHLRRTNRAVEGKADVAARYVAALDAKLDRLDSQLKQLDDNMRAGDERVLSAQAKTHEAIAASLIHFEQKLAELASRPVEVRLVPEKDDATRSGDGSPIGSSPTGEENASGDGAAAKPADAAPKVEPPPPPRIIKGESTGRTLDEVDAAIDELREKVSGQKRNR